MKLTVLSVLLLVTVMSVAQNPDIAQLDRLARQFGEAWLRGDTSTLDHMLAHEYTHTDITGKVLNRSEWLADAANIQKWSRPANATGEPSISLEDVNITFLNGSAVITGGNTLRTADPNSPPYKLRFTQVWIKEGGEWKRRFFQATAVGSAPSR